MIIDSQIQGIPCQIHVTHCVVQPPLGPSADNPDDCYGYANVEFDVLDDRGQPAPWIERKMQSADRNAIEQEIIASTKFRR